MNIALAQTQIFWEDKFQNINKAELLIKEQAKKGTDLILFPEMSFTGFSMNTPATKESNRETIQKISAMAEKYDTKVGFGWVRDAGTKCENVYTLIDERGEIISEYVKIHPFSYSGEDTKFIGGDKIAIYNMLDIPFSTFICYDLRFPELFRSVADKVSAVIIPANWPAKRAKHWKTLLRARAIENQIYILAVNCCGNMDGQYYSGDSCVINPDGLIVEMLSDKEGIITYKLVDDTAKYRATFPVLQDRRADTWRIS